MADQNPYAAPKTVAQDDENPPPLRHKRTRWQRIPAALLAAAASQMIVVSVAAPLFDEPIILLNVEITHTSAFLCFASGCAWVVSASVLIRRRWNRAVMWFSIGIGCLGAIAWLNQVVPS